MRCSGFRWTALALALAWLALAGVILSQSRQGRTKDRNGAINDRARQIQLQQQNTALNKGTSVEDSLKAEVAALRREMAEMRVVAEVAAAASKREIEAEESSLVLSSNQREKDSFDERLVRLELLARRFEHKTDVALQWSYPWENCMRLQFRNNCTREDEEEDWKANRFETLMPPCQVTLLREMAQLVSRRLTEKKVEHFWSYGTILGAARNAMIIPWTMDVDVAFKVDQFKRLHQYFSPEFQRATGFRFFRDPQYLAGLCRLCVSPTNQKYQRWALLEPDVRFYYDFFPYVDFYSLGDGAPSSGSVTVKNGPPCRFAQRDIYPLGTIKLYDMVLAAPRNVTSFLHTLYGPTWPEQPDPSKVHAHGGYQLACKPEWAPKTFS